MHGDTIWACLSSISDRSVRSCRLQRMTSVVRLAFVLALSVSAWMSCLAVDVGDRVSFKKDGEVHSGEVARINNGMAFVFYEDGGRTLPHAVRIDELIEVGVTTPQPAETGDNAIVLPQLGPAKPSLAV